jgi:UDP-N-acetylmuramyl pentapeptide phosphotransferase/UDP-N-acetylglucosamine-1-phosphate transferase
MAFLLPAYLWLARRYRIFDNPNQRSSHNTTTIRGGGIVFSAAVLIWFLMFGFQQPLIIFGTVMMAVISFIDDLIPLRAGIRILIHITAVSLLFMGSGVFNLPWPVILLAYVFTIGWINAFNFMDGINGITAFYSLVSLATFLFLNYTLSFFSGDLIILLIISVLIFSFFNARKKAMTFAGDIGSISMAFMLAWLMISLMLKTGVIVYILFFVIYGIDTVITIIFRLLKKENIFKAHRTHLYQFLSNELGWPHLAVSATYAFIQLIINILTITLIREGMMTKCVFLFFICFLGVAYLVIRIFVIRKIEGLKFSVRTKANR